MSKPLLGPAALLSSVWIAIITMEYQITNNVH